MLDTSVLSALMRPEPARGFAGWIVAQPSDELFTASVCQAEILSGIALLPAGRRRADLAAAAGAMFADDFHGRVLPFDAEAAAGYADMFANRRNAGRPTGTIDLMLAAIAHLRGASVVSRNVADFEGLGLTIINPWAG